MYTNNAYLNNSTVDRKDKSKPLVITMCGTYKLYTKPKLPTWRPGAGLTFSYYTLLLEKHIFILAAIRKKPLFRLAIWYCIDLKNLKI